MVLGIGAVRRTECDVRATPKKQGDLGGTKAVPCHEVQIEVAVVLSRASLTGLMRFEAILAAVACGAGPAAERESLFGRAEVARQSAQHRRTLAGSEDAARLVPAG